MPSPLGGILEGFLSASQLKRQREQDMADRAIKEAQQKYQSSRLDLDRQQESRLASQAEGLANYRTQSLDLREQGLGLREQSIADTAAHRRRQAEQARESLANLTDWRDRKLILDGQKALMNSQEFRERYGQDEEEALIQAMRSFDLTKQIVGQGLGSSSPTGETPLPGMPGSVPVPGGGQMFGGLPQSPAEVMIRGSGASNEPLPLVTQQMSGMQAREAATAERTRQIKQEFPLRMLKGRAQVDLMKATKLNREANTKLINVMLEFQPEQLQQKLAQGAASVGRIQAETAQTLLEVKNMRELQAQAKKTGGYVSGKTVKLLPTDPRAATQNLNQNRNTIDRLRTNYRATLKTLTEQRLMLETLPDAITNVESGIYPAGVVPPDDPGQAKIFRTNYIAQLYSMLRASRDQVNQLAPMAENQANSLKELEGAQVKVSAEKQKAQNTTPATKITPPAPVRRTHPTRPNRYSEPKRTLKPKTTTTSGSPVYQGKGFKVFKD